MARAGAVWLVAAAAVVVVLGTASGDAEARRRKRRAPPPPPPAETVEAEADAEIEIDPLPEIEIEPEDDPVVDEGPDDHGDTAVTARAARDDRPWYRRGHLHVRAGVLHVMPRASSGEVVLSDVGGPASLAVENGPIEGSYAEMGDVTTPAVLLGFMVPAWGGEVGVETVLAPPVTFELRAGGTVAEESLAPMVLGSVPTGIPALGSELGTTKALPPIVTAVYRARRGHRVRPYVGVGASYFHAYGAEITNAAMTEVAAPRVSISDAVSAVGQLGLDVRIAGRIHATVDVKALSGYATSARVENIHMRTPAFPLYESVYVGTVEVDVVARPVIVTLGAGASF